MTTKTHKTTTKRHKITKRDKNDHRGAIPERNTEKQNNQKAVKPPQTL